MTAVRTLCGVFKSLETALARLREGREDCFGGRGQSS